MTPLASTVPAVTAIILTLNEENHLKRCLDSISCVASEILVVDSGSTDSTVAIARRLGARVLHRDWVNYADQFNWALTQVSEGAQWVLRIDADEIVSSDLANEIRAKLGSVSEDVAGIFVSRRMTFLGKAIRYGGIFPIRVVRLFRRGRGRCEERWMDEHVNVDGPTVGFAGEILDDNLNPLTWWISKHNSYASREAVDLLNLEFRFFPVEKLAEAAPFSEPAMKRWLKERVYRRLPMGFRALAYFIYRFFFRFGFLDGARGTAFHVLQGFWYRYLVDLKVLEVKAFAREHNAPIEAAIERVLSIKISRFKKQRSGY